MYISLGGQCCGSAVVTGNKCSNLCGQACCSEQPMLGLSDNEEMLHVLCNREVGGFARLRAS